jgi:hypothetical protein
MGSRGAGAAVAPLSNGVSSSSDAGSALVSA